MRREQKAVRLGAGVERANQRSLRRHNLGLVLNSVANAGNCSRAEVSVETGLNPSTVSNLTAELIQRGLLREAGVTQNGLIGRPGRALELNPEGGAAIGTEISDDGIGVIALDLSGTPRYRAFVNQSNADQDPERVVRRVVELTQEALAYFRDSRTQVACTIALPGLVGSDGKLLEAPNIGWNDVPVRDYWREHGGPFPLALENEARLAAYAEMAEGVGQDLENFVYISGGTGLGSGIVLNRQIFRGTHGFAGEFGHVVIDYDDVGRGTVQTLAGEGALASLAMLPSETRPEGDGLDWVGHQIAVRARAGDVKALQAVKEAGRALGAGISTVLNLFDMEAIVLGGFLTHLAEWLREPIEQEVSRRVLSQRWCRLPILFSTIGREAAVRGAAIWSLKAILDRVSQEEQAVTDRVSLQEPIRPGQRLLPTQPGKDRGFITPM